MLIIRNSSHFERQFEKLPKTLQTKVRKRAEIFTTNPFDSRLKTHKLHGDKQNAWAFSVDYPYRIVFIFVGNNEVLYTDIGTHDELY